MKNLFFLLICSVFTTASLSSEKIGITEPKPSQLYVGINWVEVGPGIGGNPYNNVAYLMYHHPSGLACGLEVKVFLLKSAWRISDGGSDCTINGSVYRIMRWESNQ